MMNSNIVNLKILICSIILVLTTEVFSQSHFVRDNVPSELANEFYNNFASECEQGGGVFSGGNIFDNGNGTSKIIWSCYYCNSSPIVELEIIIRKAMCKESCVSGSYVRCHEDGTGYQISDCDYNLPVYYKSEDPDTHHCPHKEGESSSSSEELSSSSSEPSSSSSEIYEDEENSSSSGGGGGGDCSGVGTYCPVSSGSGGGDESSSSSEAVQTFTVSATCSNHSHCVKIGTTTPCDDTNDGTGISVSGSFSASGVICSSNCKDSCSPSSVPFGAINLPNGATVVDVQGSVSCSGDCGSQSGNSCSVGCTTRGGANVSGHVTVTYILPKPNPDPNSCSATQSEANSLFAKAQSECEAQGGVYEGGVVEDSGYYCAEGECNLVSSSSGSEEELSSSSSTEISSSSAQDIYEFCQQNPAHYLCMYDESSSSNYPSHPLPSVPSDPLNASFEKNGKCYKCNSDRGAECSYGWLWIYDNFNYDSWWYTEIDCGSGGNESSSSQESGYCKDNKRSENAVYTSNDCFNSGLDNMEAGKCYSLNSERGTQYGWINNDAQDGWWWIETPCEASYNNYKNAKEDVSNEIWGNQTKFYYDALGRKTQAKPNTRRYLFK